MKSFLVSKKVLLPLLLVLGMLSGCSSSEPQMMEATKADFEAADVQFVAEGVTYTKAPDVVTAGTHTVGMEIIGNAAHDVVIEMPNGEDEVIVTGTKPGYYVAEYDFKEGEWVYYCSIPGHRQAGMEGTLTVE